MESKTFLEKLSKEQLIQLILLAGDERKIRTEGSYIEGGASVQDGDFLIGDKGLSGAEVEQILETVLKYFPKFAHQPAHLEFILHQFLTLQEKLQEWKDLHNHLDMILNAFDPFVTRIDRASTSRRLPTLRELRNLWMKVSKRVGSLLAWAETIEHIGATYQITGDGSVRGEKWAVSLASLTSDIDQLLGIETCHSEAREDLPYPNRLSRLGFRVLHSDIGWWNELEILTKDFQSDAREYMFQADKHLRKSAMDLYYLSKQAFDQKTQME